MYVEEKRPNIGHLQMVEFVVIFAFVVIFICIF